MQQTKMSAYLRLIRLDKPAGALLLLWPVLWALWIASNKSPPLVLVVIFTAGVFIMRSAGCIINDLIDAPLDKNVARTKKRPLASREISRKQAVVMLLILLLAAFLLVLQLNALTIFLSFIGLLLTCLYPLSKYYIKAPQLILGITFNWGILMAFAASLNTIPPLAFALYFISLLWTIAYDTQYALSDITDDLKQGVNSTAIYFGEYVVKIILILQALFLLGLFCIHYYLTINSYHYLIFILAAGFIVYQYFLIKQQNPKKCFQAFTSNQWLGALLFVSCFIS